MKSVSDVAINKQKAEEAKKKSEHEAREMARKKRVPLSALIFANIVFLSLDARAIDAVHKITGSWFLSAATVLVSGAAALYWWDILYPHARRHKNKEQENIALAGTAIGIFISGVLAFVDYIIISDKTNSQYLWALVVIMTVVQGVMLARFWQIDATSAAEAKREESLSTRLDLQDTANDFKDEIENMESVLEKLEEIKRKFPGKGKAEIAARAMGYPVLAEMLADDDNDGIPNYQDKDYRVAQQTRAFASSAEVANLKAEKENPQTGGK